MTDESGFAFDQNLSAARSIEMADPFDVKSDRAVCFHFHWSSFIQSLSILLLPHFGKEGPGEIFFIAFCAVVP
jgi:hypothetical protein